MNNSLRFLDNGLALVDSVNDTNMLWRQMRHDGKNLIFVSDKEKIFNDFKKRNEKPFSECKGQRYRQFKTAE